MRLLRGIALQVVIFAVTLVCLELGLRLANFRDLRIIPPEERLPCDYDPELGWSPTPNGATILGRLNSLGFRDIELVDDARPTILFV